MTCGECVIAGGDGQMSCVQVIEDEEGTNLVQLEADESDDEGGCSGNGGNDLAGNLLGSVLVSDSDVVVHRTQVGRGGDEVDVVVRVVVLLKFHGVQAVANQRRWRWQLLHESGSVRRVWLRVQHSRY